MVFHQCEFFGEHSVDVNVEMLGYNLHIEIS